MHPLVLLLSLLASVTLAVPGTPMRDFARAMERGDKAAARQLRPAMQTALDTQHQLRLGLPSGQQLRWQLRQQPDALGRLHALCLQYEHEAQRLVRGFMWQEKTLDEHFTSKLTALYHARELIETSETLSTQEKQALQQEITDVGVRDSPRTEALRLKLLPVYNARRRK